MTGEFDFNGVTLNAQSTGDGPCIVLLHGLGMDMTVWNNLVHMLPDHRVIRYDLRGHGQSSVPEGPYKMGTLIGETEAVLDRYEVKDAVVVGLSLGGMIAQGLAVKRLDLVRALVLCSTTAKFGQPDPWHVRANIARTDGMAALAPDILARWNSDAPNAEQRILATNPEGYAGTCEAIAGTDFFTPTAGLRLATLGLCGDRDKSTPPDLVRETTELIPGSDFQLIKGAGHLAPETHASQIAKHIHAFLVGIGHV